MAAVETFMGYELGPVEEVDVKSIVRNDENSKYFAPPASTEVDKLQESIHRVGQNDPIKITKDNLLVDGHRRHLVITSMGRKTIKVKRFVGDLTKQEIRRLLIAANLVPQDTMRKLSPTKRRALYKEVYPQFEDRVIIDGKSKKTSKVALDPDKVANELGLPVYTVKKDFGVIRASINANVSKSKRTVDQRKLTNVRNNLGRVISQARMVNKVTLVEVKKEVDKFNKTINKILKG